MLISIHNGILNNKLASPDEEGSGVSDASGWGGNIKSGLTVTSDHYTVSY